jgi:hypothetical protein
MGFISPFLHLFFSGMMLNAGHAAGLLVLSLVSAGSLQYFTIKHDECCGYL